MLSNILINLLLISFTYSLSQHPILIVVSYDAFRYNYFEKNATPFMTKLKSEGCSTDHLKNVFPTKTFPNHHSIATGLYPEVHGVVGNTFYDPKLKKIVKIGPEMYEYSDSIVPIWTLNEKAAEDRYSGIMMWPGGMYPYQGINATHVVPWNSNIPFTDRIDTVLSWLTHKTKPANLVMIYLEEPDTLGHVYGPDSPVILSLLQKLDNVTKYLYEKLDEMGLKEYVNVVHVSDHGMSIVRPPQFINISQYLKINSEFVAQFADTSPCLHIIPDDGYEKEIYDKLKSASETNKHFKVYKKEELLPKWHYKNNPRIAPIFAVADVGYGFDDLAEAAKYYEKKYGIKVTDKSEFGVHGYDNDEPNMWPYFIAYGPRIKEKHKIPPFSTLDLFYLFCSLLDVKPVENNGTFANIRDILTPAKPGIPVLATVGGFILIFSLVGCLVAGSILYRRTKHRREYPSNFDNILQHGNHNLVEAQHLLEPEEI